MKKAGASQAAEQARWGDQEVCLQRWPSNQRPGSRKWRSFAEAAGVWCARRAAIVCRT